VAACISADANTTAATASAAADRRRKAWAEQRMEPFLSGSHEYAVRSPFEQENWAIRITEAAAGVWHRCLDSGAISITRGTNYLRNKDCS
jgi:hypothetical protein